MVRVSPEDASLRAASRALIGLRTARDFDRAMVQSLVEKTAETGLLLRREHGNMTTRREINSALALGFAALFSGGAATILKAEGPSGDQNPHGHTHTAASDGVRTLMQEPLAKMAHPLVTVITLTMAPGESSRPHEHTGPVFAYLLEGEIENQVEPNPPHTYKPGEYFYEPPMHVHRIMRNLSATKPATLLICQVEEKGKPFTIPVR